MTGRVITLMATHKEGKLKVILHKLVQWRRRHKYRRKADIPDFKNAEKNKKSNLHSLVLLLVPAQNALLLLYQHDQ